MSAPRQPGTLSYMELESTVKRERPCRRCGGDIRERVWNVLCDKCRNDETRVESAKKRHARKERERRAKQRLETKGKVCQ